jgi:hypothetical protein
MQIYATYGPRISSSEYWHFAVGTEMLRLSLGAAVHSMNPLQKRWVLFLSSVNKSRRGNGKFMWEKVAFLSKVCLFSSGWNISRCFICLHGISVFRECDLNRLKVRQISGQLKQIDQNCVSLTNFNSSLERLRKYNEEYCKTWSYPRNRPWKPIGLWDVKDPTLSRQSAHRWR